MKRPREHAPANVAVRVTLAGLCLVVLYLSALALVTVLASKRSVHQAERAIALDDAYDQARDGVAAEDFWVTEYLLQLIPDFEQLDAGELRRSHAREARLVTSALGRARRRGTPADGELADRLLVRHIRYLAAVEQLFAAVDAENKARALEVELEAIDPAFSFIDVRLRRAALSHSRAAGRRISQLDRVEERGFIGTIIGFPVGIILLALLARRLRSYRRGELVRLQSAALTDNLTGLANHRAFQERLQLECERHRRSGAPLSLVLLDLDDLKRTNDLHGHPMGDRHLKILAEQLSSTARAIDGVFRIGGDEFAAILPGAAAGQALRFVRRLQAKLGAAQATAGICELADGLAPDELVELADQALLSAKRSHRDSLVYTESP